MDGVLTRRIDAEGFEAHAALAIGGEFAAFVGGAFRAIRAAAIESRFVAIFGIVAATGSRTHTARAIAAGALQRIGARFAIGTREARATAIDIGFTRVLDAVRAQRTDTLVHGAQEGAGAALDAVDALNASAAGFAHVDGTESALRFGNMHGHAIDANVVGAFEAIIVEIGVEIHVHKSERGIALSFNAIAVRLGGQCGTGRLQAFANALAIHALRFSTEVRRALIRAIGIGRAFGRRTAAAAGHSAGASTSACSAASSIAGARRSTARGRRCRARATVTTKKLDCSDSEACSEKPSSFDLHGKHSSLTATAAVNWGYTDFPARSGADAR